MWILALFAGLPFFILAGLSIDAWQFWVSSRSVVAELTAPAVVTQYSRRTVNVEMSLRFPVGPAMQDATLEFIAGPMLRLAQHTGERISIRYLLKQPRDVRLASRLYFRAVGGLAALVLGILAVMVLCPLSPWQ